MKRYRLIWMLLAAAMLLSTAVLAAADVVPAPDAENGIFYVDDAACLSDATKDMINAGNIALTCASGGQVGVVTLDFLNDLNTEQYAYEVINQWGVGDAGKNNGTVFVIVTAEKKCWITSGLDDFSAGNMELILEENCYDALDSGNYDQAVYDTVTAIFAWYESYYGISLSDYPQTIETAGTRGFGGGSAGRDTSPAGYGFRQIVVMMLVVYILFRLLSKHPGLLWCIGPYWCGGGRRGGFGGGGFGGGGFGGGGFGGFGGGGGHGGGAGRR